MVVFFRINLIKDRAFEIFKIALNNFLTNCESSEGAYVYYSLKFKIQNLKDLDDQLFIDALNQLDIRCKEEQVSARIFGDYSSEDKQNKLKYGPETPLVGDLLSDSLKDGLKISTWYFSLIFSKEIDISSMIYYQDPIEEIPKNLIDDFDQFTKKMKMSNKDKSDLITIFKKWKNNV